MSEPSPPGTDGGDDARIADLLGELQTLDDDPGGDLTRRVVRTARWQRGFKRTFLQVSTLFGGLAQGAAGLLGVRREGEDSTKQ